jgi:hypothetical protein
MQPLIKSTMNRVAIKNEMIARRTTQVVVILRHQGVQRSKRSFLMQPAGFNLIGTTTLWAAYFVRLLVKGMAINFVAFLASHPAKPLSRPCRT